MTAPEQAKPSRQAENLAIRLPPAVFRSSEPQSESRRVTMADFWIEQGWYKTLKDGSRKLTRADWRVGGGLRQEAVRFLVEKVLRKEPRDIMAEDFNSNRLGGLLGWYYGGSPHAALTDAGYAIMPWEMGTTPTSFYELPSNRIAAIRWLVEKTGKNPRDLMQDDFNSNRLGGLLAGYYAGSPHRALADAGYDILPWEMLCTPGDVYEHVENRIAAVRWLVGRVGKQPRDVMADDFRTHRLGGLLTGYYGGSPYNALREAGYEMLPWEMIDTPYGFYEHPDCRIAATRWLAEKLGKAPRDITKRDFNSNRLAGLIRNYYSGRPFLALLDAKLVTQNDEAYMCHHGLRAGSAPPGQQPAPREAGREKAGARKRRHAPVGRG